MIGTQAIPAIGGLLEPRNQPSHRGEGQQTM
jgi:hypothetical protein